MGIAISPATRQMPKAIESARITRGAAAAAGRAISVRLENKPTARMIDPHIAHPAVTRPGVAADSDNDGIPNCGAGPGLGPTAKVNAPRTGWPAAEIHAQCTKYH